MKKLIDENGMVIIAVGMAVVFFLPFLIAIRKNSLENKK